MTSLNGALPLILIKGCTNTITSHIHGIQFRLLRASSNREILWQNIPYVIVRVDDILVSGVNDEDHLRNLGSLLNTSQVRKLD